ncbi:hypothetical protein LSUCC0387_05420 [Rhodobacterales bacterium LSUCC0387]|nr:hypothetical protein [Rhodobacterales bacterium LSUCC0387]
MHNHLVAECVVIGSGPGGSLIANRFAKAGHEVIVLEAGPEIDRNVGVAEGVFKYYWNAGIVPMLGPFALPFGQAKVVGGGTQINGALFWPTPQKALNKWTEELPNSVYASSTWEASELALANEFKVSSSHKSYDKGNVTSKLLRGAARAKSWRVVPVPRAVERCQNRNRCASACPLDAKLTANKVLLAAHPEIDVRSSCQVHKIEKLKGGKWRVKYRHKNKYEELTASRVVLCAGATESANLLKNSGLSKRAGQYFEFHINFKIIAKFNDNVDPNLATILTEQVQEFMADDMIFMSSNFTAVYAASSLTHVHPEQFKAYMSDRQNLGIYTVMIRPEVNATVRSFLGQSFISWGWKPRSFMLAKRGLEILSELLFAAGATEIVLPIKSRQSKARSLREAISLVELARPSQLLGVSVHGMSACKMGLSKDNSVVDLDAEVWGHKNLFVVDSSILPSNTGESPQGTILATAEEIVRRWNI